MLNIVAELQKLSRNNMTAAERVQRWNVIKGLAKVLCSSIEGAVMSFVEHGPVKAIIPLLGLLRNDPGHASFEVCKAIIRSDIALLCKEARYHPEFMKFFNRHFYHCINKWR
jgi:hypothetical protein